jgi:alkylation response protein AidB-like acyl-CoA dehydrogenase
MDFSFSEAQQALREVAGKVIAGHATQERLRALETGAFYDLDLWKALAKADLFDISADPDGIGFAELCLLLEQVGRAVAPVPVLGTLMCGALPVARFGTAEQKQRFLPRIAKGEVVLTAALAELGNHDPGSPRTAAKRDGSDFRVDGVKDCVPAVDLAERVLVPARLDGGTVVLLVDPRAPGVTLERQTSGTGEPLARLRLSNVRVEAADLLGDATTLDWIVERARVGTCAQQLGVVERAMRMTAEYATTRQQFDRPIATFQAVSQRAADAYIDVEACRLALLQAMHRVGTGEPAGREVSIAKYWASEAGHRVLSTAQHIHGGMGFDRDYPLHRYYLWSKHLELSLGNAAQEIDRLGAMIAEAG